MIGNLEPFCARLTRRDQRNEDWQRVQLELARAYYKKSLDLKRKDPADGRAKNFSRDASKLIKALARTPGNHKSEARQLMTEWNLKVEAEVAEVDDAPLNTFADAKRRASDLIIQIEGLYTDEVSLRQQLASAQPNEQAVIQTEMAEAQQRIAATAKNCFAALDRATVLSGPETSPEDLNQIRYLRCVCFYFQKSYYESALIGEFLVRKYQSIAYSRQAGGIAIRSYVALHNQSTPEDRGFEHSQLTSLSDKLIKLWPGTNEANNAAGTIARLILSKSDISNDEFQEVMSLIDTIEKTSLERAALDVKLGTKLWRDFVNKSGASGADPEAIKPRLEQAIEYLSAGVSKFNTGNLRNDAAFGALYLVKAQLKAGNLDAALRQLELASVSPIDLVKQKNPVVFNSRDANRFVSETYLTAGKTYLAAIKKFPGRWPMA